MKLSQHFLTDETIISRQIEYSNLKKDDVILEIGPGLGALTKKISEHAKVIAIEIDSKFIETLKLIENVTVINEDIMNVDLQALKYNKVISNIPYHISSDITFKLLNTDFEYAVLMYQKEFAERMAAQPGTKKYSRLSVMTQINADCKILEYIPKESFSPVPKVDSCLISLKPKKSTYNVNMNIFDNVVRAIFMHKRKTIKNALLSGNIISRDMIKNIPYRDKRAECLDLKKIFDLSKKIEALNEKVTRKS